MEYDSIVKIVLQGAEKRKVKGDRYYVYCLDIAHESGKHAVVWRRYSEFDGLRETLIALRKFFGASNISPQRLSPRSPFAI
jgi:hypothetical protein